MTKSIFLYKINDNFESLMKGNNIDIILTIYLKSKENKFYENQFNLIIDKLDINLIKNNIISNFSNKNNFFIYEDKIILKNIYKEKEEIIKFYSNYLEIIIDDNSSLFLDYLSIYFVDLIAIEEEDEKIYPLHLVKSNILV